MISHCKDQIPIDGMSQGALDGCAHDSMVIHLHFHFFLHSSMTLIRSVSPKSLESNIDPSITNSRICQTKTNYPSRFKNNSFQFRTNPQVRTVSSSPATWNNETSSGVTFESTSPQNKNKLLKLLIRMDGGYRGVALRHVQCDSLLCLGGLNTVFLLMEEILHHLGCIKPCK